MRYAWGTSLLVLAAGLVLACDNDSPTSETTLPGGKPLAAIDNAPACLTTAAQAEQHAILYFQSDAARLAQALIDIDLIAAQCVLLAGQGGPRETINRLGFGVLRLVSASRAERASGTGWDGNTTVLNAGSDLANSILTFMDVGFQENTSPGIAFAEALRRGGIFEVRGPAVNDDVAAATTHSLATFRWGVRPGVGWSADADPVVTGATGEGVLIYGMPLTGSTGGTTEALVDRNGTPGIQSGEAAYSFHVIPEQRFDPEVRVGTCWPEIAPGASSPLLQAVLQREPGSAGLVVEFAGEPGFCGGTTALGGSLGSRLLRFAANNLLATPLHAAVVGTSGGTSGAGSSLSDWFLVHLEAVTAAADGAGQGDTRVGEALTLGIKVTGQQGTPVEKAIVELTIKSNNGKSATFCELPCDDRVNDNLAAITVLTDELGVASFARYGVAKPGGYRITAEFDYPAPPFESDYSGTFVTPLFNVSK